MPTVTASLKAEAARLGFSLSGVAAAADAATFPHYRDWIAAGRHGEMKYLADFADERRHPRAVMEAVRFVLMVGFEYAGNEPDPPPAPNRGRVARYARGPDYHRVVWDRLNELGAWLERAVPGCGTEAVADTAPLLERDFARKAGLGWVGKNTMLISPGRGSFFFLGALLTDAILDPDEPFDADHCGTCTRCLDACPTAAFPEPGVLDATKCISYLTIELRTRVPDELQPGLGDRLYGCDVCQEVCPWNRFAGRDGVPFPVRPDVATLDCVELLRLDDAAFRKRFRGTVFFRARRGTVLRSAALVLGTTGDESGLAALEAASRDADAGLAEAAAWAAGRVRQRCSRM